MMPDELQRLLDNLIHVAGHFFGLPLMRELQQAVGDRLAPESLVANDVQVLAKVLVKRGVSNVFHSRGQRLRAGGNSRQRVVDFMNHSSRESTYRRELL